MASLHTLPRTGLWLCLSLCLLLAATPSEAATRKYVKTPDTSAVLTSNNDAYLSNNNVWVKGDSMTSYIDRLGKKTPVGGIVPKKAFSVPSIGTKLKGLVKGNLASLAMSAAISTALAGVGWLMEDGVVVKKKDSPATDPATNYYWEPKNASFPYYNLLQTTTSAEQLCHNGTILWAQKNNNNPISILDVTATDTSGSYNCHVKFYNAGGWWEQWWPMVRKGNGCTAPATYDAKSMGCVVTTHEPLSDADLEMLDPWLNKQSAAWLKQLLSDMCTGSLKPAQCFAELEVAAQQLEGPATVDGGTTTKTSTYTRPDGAMGTQVEQQKTAFALNYGPDYFDYTTTTTTTQTQDGTKTGESTQTDSPEVTQEEPKDDTQQDDQKQEEPKREFSGDECEAPILCSGDAIDCAMVRQEKSLRCAYEKQSDYEKNQDKIKAAVAGQKFEIDDSSEIEIPSFINQGTRFLPAACPADKSFSLKTGGGRSFVLTYEPLCAAATDLGYLIVVAVGVFCVLYVGRSLGGE